MSTYQDKQQLADFVYDKKNHVTIGSEIWTVVDGLSKETSSGYYGAVYTNGKGEYILASRGTENFANKVHDAGMHLFDTVPPEFTDAYELAAKATAYVQAHGGTLSFDGHSLGGTISQLLAITFGSEATAFNPYNSQNFLDSIERVEQSIVSGLIARKEELQQQVANGETGSQASLDLVTQQLIKIEANNKLYDAWNGGSIYNIINYRIENDPVSGATDKPLLGETITIKYESKGDSEYQATVLGHHAVSAFTHDVETFHKMKYFSSDDLLAEEKDINISTNNGSLDDKYELGVVELFKDKTKYEIDAIDTAQSQVRVSQDHELFVGVEEWSASDDDRSQLITDIHDSIYKNAGFHMAGTTDEIDARIAAIKLQYDPTKYDVTSSSPNGDTQIYLLIKPKDPAFPIPPLPDPVPPTPIDPNANKRFRDLENWRPPVPRDPLALDLDGDGLELISQDVGVVFDHNADGLKQGTSWLKGDDAWVVIDKDANGMIDSGRELLGDEFIKSNGNKAKSGFDALSDFDSNQDGMVDVNDTRFKELKIWQDKNSDGISQSNELKTLDAAGIVSLAVTPTKPGGNFNCLFEAKAITKALKFR